MSQPAQPDPASQGGRPEGEFVRLFMAHQRRIYCYLAGLLGNAEDAEDLLQETAVVLFNKFEEFRLGTNFFSWACQTAQYLAFNHRRKDSRRGTVAFDDDVFQLLADVPPAEVSALDIRRSAMRSCLTKLPAVDRGLFEKRYGESMSVKSLALELSRPADSVCRSLGRIRRLLVECVQRKLGSMAMEGIE